MSELPQSPNRRAFPRASCSIPVCYGETKESEALAVNVTSEGISLISERKLPVGAMVQLRLQLHEGAVPVRAIVRYRNAEVTGLEFVQISMADRLKLEDAVYGCV